MIPKNIEGTSMHFPAALRQERAEVEEKYKDASMKHRRFLGQLAGDIGILMATPPERRPEQTLILARIAATAEAWHDNDYEIKKEPAAGYTFTGETKDHDGRTMHRVQYPDGFVGGWIESTRNLKGDGRVLHDAMVWDNAVVSGEACLRDKAYVSGDARVEGNAVLEGCCTVSGNARVLENAMVWDEAVVCGDAVVTGKAHVRGRARVEGNAEVSGEAKVGGKAIICEKAKVWGRVSGNAVIAGNTVVEHGAVIIDPLHGVEIGIAGLAQTIQQRNGEVYQPVDEWSPTDWGCALAGEVGELCNFLKKRLRGQDIPDKAIADEIADVMIYLCLLSSRMNIDLEQAVISKFNEVSQRKGSSYYLDETVDPV